MAKAKVVQPFFKISESLLEELVSDDAITTSHIAAVLAAMCFSGRQNDRSSLGLQGLWNYVGLPRVRANRVVNDLDALKILEKLPDKGGVLIKQGTKMDRDIFIPTDIVLHESRPLARLARIPGDAGKLLLRAYQTHDQQLNLSCDVGSSPYQQYEMQRLAEYGDYGLWISGNASLVGADEATKYTLDRLCEEKLLHRSVAVYYGAPEILAEVAYHLTEPYPDEALDLGTRLKQLCRTVGFSAKEGRWACFAPKGVTPVVVAAYSPYWSHQGPDAADGRKLYMARQAEAEKALVKLRKATVH